MNMQTNSCPCCGSSLLRHARQSGIYWFCTSCWQEVPTSSISKMSRLESIAVRTLADKPLTVSALGVGEIIVS